MAAMRLQIHFVRGIRIIKYNVNITQDFYMYHSQVIVRFNCTLLIVLTSLYHYLRSVPSLYDKEIACNYCTTSIYLKA
jgi:hypothetical protein